MSIVAVYQTYCDENNLATNEIIIQALDAINQKCIISRDSDTQLVINKSNGGIVNDQSFGAIMEGIKRYSL